MENLTLPDRVQRGAIVLVSGWRQAGKTTLLLAVRQAAQEAGLRVGGFLSAARFEAGEKTGIDLVDAHTGRTLPLAVAASGGAITTGHYSFEPAALEAGLAFAEEGKSADVFLVDELGPLELVKGEGWIGVIDMLRERAFGVALVVVRPELIAQARDWLGLTPDSPLINLDESERDELAQKLSSWVIKNLT